MPSLNRWWWRFLEKYVYAVPEPPPRKRTKPMEVLCVGLPWSATESLQTALLKLGYDHTYHGWDIVYGAKLFIEMEFDEILRHSVAVTDAAASVVAAELIAAYPDAKVVLDYRKDLDAWHEKHCNMIRGLVPKDKLLEWTVEDGWGLLCKFLDKAVPDEPYPHVNKASVWEDHESEVTKRYLMSPLSGVAVLSSVGIATGAIAYKTMW
ncbi:hypothetical protein J7337_012665 [Fusarium musae]|uniref:Uncharacterized protein n=1 Tax=Fusarium musae TaxID=1042133 RepID=A0A9P8D685_9HYPO|nr:hypothetical protein J7337_012665 [Fusarium musae]KAG9496089.1 hypothetical protein J7337_012665 [Fusarium musae]